MAYTAAKDKKLRAVCVARIGGSAFGGCLPDIALDSSTKLRHHAIDDHYHKCLKEGKKFANFYEFLYQETLRIVANADRFKDLRTVHCTDTTVEAQPQHAQLLVKTSRPGWNRVPTCFKVISDLEAEGTALYKGFKLSEILWLNAWDPHSVVGNGNANDNSLDGYYGRASSLGLMCFPMTNPWIQYRGLPPTPEYMKNNEEIKGLKF